MINLSEEQEIEVKNADESLNNAIKKIDLSDFEEALQLIEQAFNTYQKLNIEEGISICFSWMAFLRYILKKDYFSKTLEILGEGKFLAQKTKYIDAIATNYFVSGLINFYENNFEDTKNILNYVKKITENKFINEKIDMILQKIDINTHIEQKTVTVIENNIKPDSENFALITLLKLGRLVSVETNIDRLIEIIAKETSKALNADRCTVFMLDKDKNELWSKVALGMDTQEIRFPADKGLAGYVAMNGNTVNIQDAYTDERFNKDIDNQTGYVTKTILCMPIRNIRHEIMGVFQVLNKQNGIFTTEDEDLLVAIGSSAGIALENTRLFEHQQQMLNTQKHLFASFIDTLAASIDARDKITSGHSSRVRMYTELICDELNLDDKEKDVIKNAATLHDIGKIGIRDSVLQKEGKLTDEEYSHIQQHAFMTYEILSKIYVSGEYGEVAKIAASHHEKYNGSGYFKSISGEEIPIGGRILAVADVFDAITSKRHYRDKMPINEALDILRNGINSHFDPNIINAFFNINCDKIVDVFLVEYNAVLADEHRHILQNYKISDLYNLITSEEPKNEHNTYFIELFKTYYTNKSTGD